MKKNNSSEASNYHHGNLREALLINGLTLLESPEGINFSLRELTRTIGVSANAMYRHFANKDELLTALAINGFEKLLTFQAQAIQDHHDPVQGFLLAGKQYIHFAITHPTLFRLMYGRFAIVHNDERLRSMAKLAYEGILYGSANALNLAVDSKEAENLAIQCWSLVHGLSNLLIDGQFEHLSDIERDELIDNAINSLHIFH